MGSKKRPYYRIIAVDSRKKRDGAYLERIGYYHPLSDPPAVKVDADRALKWLRVGAEPSGTVRSLLKGEGILYRRSLERRGLAAEQIDSTMADWFAKRNAQSEAAAATPHPKKKRRAKAGESAKAAAPAPAAES